MNNFYVSPEQLITDKSEFAKKGIEKGRTTVIIETKEGLLFIADNPSKHLFKTSEIYDQIGFAGAGKYSEFENLRIAGIRHADMKGFTYSRKDVLGRDIANLYSQALGFIFNNEIKPYEVELLIGEVTDENEKNIYHISYDGTLSDRDVVCSIGGKSEELDSKLSKLYRKPLFRNEAIELIKEFIINETPGKTTNFEISVIENKGNARYFQRLL